MVGLIVGLDRGKDIRRGWKIDEGKIRKYDRIREESSGVGKIYFCVGSL